MLHAMARMPRLLLPITMAIVRAGAEDRRWSPIG